jgi:hypothetical protein
VVFGDADFISNQMLAAGNNQDLFLNAIAWMVGEQNQISIRSNEEGKGKLTLDLVSLFLTATLTLLVVPSLYDSIEINWERLTIKFWARATNTHPVPAFFVTLLEFLATILLLRFFYRCGRWLFNMDSPVEHPAERAVRLHGFAVPAWWTPRPQRWQHRRSGTTPQPRPNAYAPRPAAAD